MWRHVETVLPSSQNSVFGTYLVCPRNPSINLAFKDNLSCSCDVYIALKPNRFKVRSVVDGQAVIWLADFVLLSH